MTPEQRKIARAMAQAAELAALRLIAEGSMTYGKGALLEALNLCVDNNLPLPHWLAQAVRAELLLPMPQETLKHYRRWRAVRRLREERPLMPTGRPGTYSGIDVPHREISYDESLARVARDDGGSERSIRRSYELVERDLPPSLRYPRTYTRRSR